MPFAGPFAQIDQAAAVGTKGPKWIVFIVNNGFMALWAAHDKWWFLAHKKISD